MQADYSLQILGLIFLCLRGGHVVCSTSILHHLFLWLTNGSIDLINSCGLAALLQ